jgi:hypothetical protein
MTTDINNFVTLSTFKNGRVKILQTVSNEANIYKLLCNLGYRKTKLNNKNIYLKREGASLLPIHRSEIKQAFFKFLDLDADYSKTLDGTNRGEIINWFYQKNRIKVNGLYDHYLEDNLTGEETHRLLMLTNQAYKHNFDIKQLLSKFEEWHFSKTIDKINSYSQ